MVTSDRTWTGLSAMTEPDPEPDMGPGDCYEECKHAEACRMQWERAHGEWDDEQFASIDRLAEALGCGEGCECWEDSCPTRFSGTMRPAKRVVTSDEDGVGSCHCGSCGGSIGIKDRYCKHCGSELS